MYINIYIYIYICTWGPYQSATRLHIRASTVKLNVGTITGSSWLLPEVFSSEAVHTQPLTRA